MRCDICGSKECCGGELGRENNALKSNINYMLSEIENIAMNDSLPVWVEDELKAIQIAVENAMGYKHKYHAKSLTTGEKGEFMLTKEEFKHVSITHPAWVNWVTE